MAATYQITINLDDETIQFLNDNQYQLQIFKGVYSSAPASTYISLWTTINPPFGTLQEVSWQDQLGGYFSKTAIAYNVTIYVSSSRAMQLGETLILESSGTTTLTTDGIAGEITLVNNEDEVFTCGMTNLTSNSSNAPICAIPITGSGGTIFMAPYECVVLLFATLQIPTGTVIKETAGGSITITLSAAQPSIKVSYSVNTGWNTGGSPQATVNNTEMNLAQGLVLPLALPKRKNTR